jgi:hypothetical protein
MKLGLFGALVSVALLALAVGLLLFVPTPIEDRVGTVVSSVDRHGLNATVTVTEAKQIPIYPESQNIREDPLDPRFPSRKITDYQAPGNTEDVLNFYKVALTNLGWEVHNASIYGMSSAEHEGFTWSGADANLPYKLSLTVDVSSFAGTQTLVSLWFEYQPDAELIPVYPNAHSVSTRYEPLEEIAGINYQRKVTTYTTGAMSVTIQAYYRTVLSDAGWHYQSTPDAGGVDVPGIDFFYSLGNIDHPWFGRATLLTSEGASGGTKVELQAWGSDFDVQENIGTAKR